MKTKKMNAEIVSVIVPVYNVEKYLDRCITSILGQTYHNLNIILVDDGSTDSSGAICDGYAAVDERIQVIHKKNGGLSDARNVGLDAADGEYVHFLDSDDFIARDAIKFLYDSLKIHNADVSTFGYVNHHREDSDISSHDLSDNVQTVLSAEEALGKLLYENTVTTSACMKLYKRELFNTDTYFPPGKLCEDLGTIYKLFSRTETIVINTAPKYYYFQRSDSIIHSEFTKRRIDGLDFANEQLDFITLRYPNLIEAARYRLFAEAAYITVKMPLCGARYKNARAVALSVINQYKVGVLLDGNAKSSMRQRAFVALLGARTMVLVYRFRSFIGRRIKKVIG